jgi:hypothetical protein
MACWHILTLACWQHLYANLKYNASVPKTVLKIENGEVKATFRLPADLMKKLKYMAIDKNTSVNALVIQALDDFLEGKLYGKAKK